MFDLRQISRHGKKQKRFQCFRRVASSLKNSGEDSQSRDHQQKNAANLLGVAAERRRKKSHLIQGLTNKMNPTQEKNNDVLEEVPVKKQSQEKQDEPLTADNTFVGLRKIIKPAHDKEKKADFSAFGEQFPAQKINSEETEKKESEQNNPNLLGVAAQRRRKKSHLIEGLANKMNPTQEKNSAISEDVPLKKQNNEKQDEQLTTDKTLIAQETQKREPQQNTSNLLGKKEETTSVSKQVGL